MSDASLIPDESYVATSHRGLTYPMGDRAPGEGEALDIADGVRWVRIPMPGSLNHINCWLVDDGEGFAVVDTGLQVKQCKDAWRAVLGQLSNAPRRVICTHFHPDHIGLAGWFCAKFGVDVWMSRGEWLTGRLMIADSRDAVPDEVVALWRAAGWNDEQVATASANGWARFKSIVAPLPLGYRRMVDGEVIRIGAQDWRVVVGSGHCPEHACLVNEAAGVMIAGDQVLPRISSNVSLTATEPEADPLGEWLASIAKLKQLPDDLLVLPAHGEPFRGLHARLDALDREHRLRLDILHEFLSEPRRAIDCFGRMFRRKIDDKSIGLATGETLAHLRRLEVEGRAIRQVHEGVWFYRAA